MFVRSSLPGFPRRSLMVLLVGGLVAGCGKRGQLDPPPGAEPPAKSDPADATGRDALTRPKRVPITPPKRDLPIDFLLD